MLLDQVSIHAWIHNNVIKTETGQDLDFHTHRYLFDIYRDDSKYLCCLKAAQIGFSTMAIFKTLWLARNKQLDIGYILPTVDMVHAFVGSKVNRIIQQNPILQEWVKDKDSIVEKQIDTHYIHYKGAMTQRTAIMISLDMLVADEYDKAPQEILELYDSRLQHSKHGYKWVFSNPSAPDFGVDKFFKQSDQKKWHIKHSCDKTYVLDEDCIDYEREMYACPHCKSEITDEERRMGEWVATSKGDWSGYWIPAWINPMIKAKYICKEKKEKPPDYFANMVAGLPYIGSGNKVTTEVIKRNLIPQVNSQSERIIIGVDTGLPIHYVIGNKEGLFYYGKCKPPSMDYNPYDELESLLKRWSNSIIVSDQGGDLIGIRALQQKYPGRVFLCYYRPDRKTKQIITWGIGEEYGKVMVDRNRAIQLLIDEMVDTRVPINGNETDWHDFTTHWLNIYRVWDVDSLGVPIFKWERNGPDHWVHAHLYQRVGMDKFGRDKGGFITPHEDLFPEKGMVMKQGDFI